jgi:nicotinamide mononucleotide transporter
VYPTGLVNTVIYIYLSYQASLYGEASVNLYYTVMSLYGWWMWTRRNPSHELIVQVQWSSKKDWVGQLIFFGLVYLLLYVVLDRLRLDFAAETIPWADALASASAFTGMWLMTRKKIESWYWWIITNVTSIPLYFVKGYMVTSVYYIILLVMAFAGLASWIRKAVKS